MSREAATLNRRLGIEAGYVDQTGKREAAPAATIETLWRTLMPGARAFCAAEWQWG